MDRSVVVIGNFDGVHKGHQKLIARAYAHAKDLGGEKPLSVVAVSFWPHPSRIFNPNKGPKLLCSLEQRIKLLKAYGVDEVRIVPFTEEFSKQSPAQFVNAILVPLNPALIVVGQNFRFGYKAAGSPATLRELSPQFGGFKIDEVDLATIQDETTSSTVIRQLLADGDVAGAAANLGRYFQVSGTVVVGDQRGRELGFPTANLPVSNQYCVPKDGVYAGWLTIRDEPGKKMPAVISVGTNPTFNGLERRVETNVLFRDDLALYGVHIDVDFAQHLRDQLKFSKVDELVTQMNHDASQAAKILENLSKND